MADPKISVIVPVHNLEELLPVTVNSLKNQTANKSWWEAIFVNDCSTDRSLKELEKLTRYERNMKVISTPTNSGVSVARNYGATQAQGNYFAQLDGDDRYQPQAISVILDHINRNPDAGYFYSGHQHVNTNGRILKKFPTRLFEQENLLHYNFISPIKTTRRDINEAIGGFKTGYAEDWDHPLKASEILDPSQFTRIDEILYDYVMREGSCTHTVPEKDKINQVSAFLKPHIEKITGKKVEVFWSHKQNFADGNTFNYYDWREV